MILIHQLGFRAYSRHCHNLLGIGAALRSSVQIEQRQSHRLLLICLTDVTLTLDGCVWFVAVQTALILQFNAGQPDTGAL